MEKLFVYKQPDNIQKNSKGKQEKKNRRRERLTQRNVYTY